MVLPLSVIRASQTYPMMVELKNGETYNGHLVSCDTWMNVYLKDVICTSKNGDKFWKLGECYIKGSSIKYMRIPEDIMKHMREDRSARHRSQFNKASKPPSTATTNPSE